MAAATPVALLIQQQRIETDILTPLVKNTHLCGDIINITSVATFSKLL